MSSLSHGLLPFDPLLELSAERVTSPAPLPMVNRYVRHQWISPTAGDSLLSRSGAILFRGFPVSSASDFNDASTPPAMKILATASVVLGPKPKFSVMTNFPYHLWIAYLGISLLKSTSSADLCDDCSKILDEECVALQWRKDDDLLLDKLTVLNSQRPLTMVSVLEIDLQFDILDELTYVKHHLSNVALIAMEHIKQKKKKEKKGTADAQMEYAPGIAFV
ncbi:hypothetical protein R6Q59_026256 [Mikania micrantha]